MAVPVSNEAKQIVDTLIERLEGMVNANTGAYLDSVESASGWSIVSEDKALTLSFTIDETNETTLIVNQIAIKPVNALPVKVIRFLAKFTEDNTVGLEFRTSVSEAVDSFMTSELAFQKRDGKLCRPVAH